MAKNKKNRKRIDDDDAYKRSKKAKINDDNVYTAERILKKRIVRNQVQYLIKWKDWTDECNTWVNNI